MPRDGSSTRANILATAMRLFVEQGYDKTSLREIADEIGVTKAALYYHFRTKDDIVSAAYEDYAARLGEIVDWVEAQPPGPERDAGFADRLLALVDGEGRAAMRFGQANPTVVSRGAHSEQQLALLTRMMSALAGDAPTAEASLRATLAYGALVLSGAMDSAPVAMPGSPQDRRDAARTVALELLAPLSGGGA